MAPRLRAIINEWVRPLALVVAVIVPFRAAVADWNDVPTGSMTPTILEGDRIVVDKLAYDLRVPFTYVRLARWGAPRRGDVVVLYEPGNGQRLVKRVVGLPGDVVALRGDVLYLNGKAQRYSRPEVAGGNVLISEYFEGRPHALKLHPWLPARRDFGPVRVPAGDYFVMGDNRDLSFDSRYFGPVPAQRIVGRAVAVAFSLDPAHDYAPRWARFFSRLQ